MKIILVFLMVQVIIFRNTVMTLRRFLVLLLFRLTLINLFQTLRLSLLRILRLSLLRILRRLLFRSLNHPNRMHRMRSVGLDIKVCIKPCFDLHFMQIHVTTLRCSTARARQSYTARVRDLFSGGYGPSLTALSRPADRPGKSLAGVAGKKLKKWNLNICSNEFLFIYTFLPFRTAYKAVSMNVPPHGGEVRIISPHHNSLSYGAERNFF